MNIRPAGSSPTCRRGRKRARMLLPLLLMWGVAPTYAGNCTITLSGINFGSYDPIEQTTPLDSSGNVIVDCAPETFGELLFGVNVDIAFGTGSSGTYAARTMRQPPSSVLRYNLYTTATRTTVWGNGTGGTDTVGGAVGGIFSGQPSPRSFAVYGRIPLLQDPSVGVHGDTVIVTVTF